MLSQFSKPVIDYGHILHMDSPAQCLHLLDSIHHGPLSYYSLWLYDKPLSSILWSELVFFLDACRITRWCVYICKAILGKLLCYLSSLLILKRGNHSLHPLNHLYFVLPKGVIGLSKRPFKFMGSVSLNKVQSCLKLLNCVPQNIFKNLLKSNDFSMFMHNCATWLF